MLDLLRATTSFVDGYKIVGSTLVKLPKVKLKTEKQYLGGSDGEGEFAYGMQGMDAGIKSAAMQERLHSMTALAPGIRKTFQFNGATVGETDGVVKSIRARMTGFIADDDAGDWKHGDKSEWDFRIVVKTYKLTIDSRVIYDIDPENFIRIINGVDQLAAMRQALELE